MKDGIKFTNVEIWDLAERGEVEEDMVFKDQEGNSFVFTGKSFQTLNDEDDVFRGFCVGDMWEFVGKLEYKE